MPEPTVTVVITMKGVRESAETRLRTLVKSHLTAKAASVDIQFGEPKKSLLGRN